MTCTEVQRTLVKSPPELWAELSDPDALSRHLAELGEVRITSVEPESAVRWETPDATGAVEIGPSGWGTKVTLSVTRKAGAGASADAPAEVLPQAAPAPASAPAGPANTPAAEASAAPPEPSAPPAQGIGPVAPVAPSTDGGFTFGAGTPHTAAARAEILRRAVAPVEPEPPASCEESPAPEPSASYEPPAPAESPAPVPTRRGFFARLFAWRGREPEESEFSPLPAHQDAPASAVEGDQWQDDEAAPLTEPAPAAESPQPGAFDALQARFAPAATEASETTRPAPPVEQPPIESPARDAAALSAELRAAEELAGGATQNPRDEQPPAPEEPAEPAGEQPAEPSAEQPAEPNAEQPAEPSAEQPAEPSDEQPATPGDEQVRAILTDVLDRLGAAHHRPFSRA